MTRPQHLLGPSSEEHIVGLEGCWILAFLCTILRSEAFDRRGICKGRERLRYLLASTDGIPKRSP